MEMLTEYWRAPPQIGGVGADTDNVMSISERISLRPDSTIRVWIEED